MAPAGGEAEPHPPGNGPHRRQQERPRHEDLGNGQAEEATDGMWHLSGTHKRAVKTTCPRNDIGGPFLVRSEKEKNVYYLTISLYHSVHYIIH